MEVVNARSALLSNYEVLDLLKELESDYLLRTKNALRVKKEEEAAGIVTPAKHEAASDEISQNLRTIEFEAIAYLSADYQATVKQSEASIAKLVKDLNSYELTKAEKLQIVNLAPTEPVELYVIVEELEDRLGAQMDDILDNVRTSVNAAPGVRQAAVDDAEIVEESGESTSHDETWDEEADENGIEFDDTGEGAGVEGDLDMDDD